MKLSIFLFYVALIFSSCSPAPTGQKLYLYASQSHSRTYLDIIAAASKEARKQGTTLVYQTLGDFISQPLPAMLEPINKSDAIAVIAYDTEWNNQSPILQQRFKELKALLRKQNIKLGVWLLATGYNPKLPPSLKQPNSHNFDAVSSASTERPAKAMATKFFGNMAQYRPISSKE